MATATVPRGQPSSAPPPQAPAAVVEREPPHKWLIAGSVMIGTIMAVLDTSIVNVALADMSGTLGATIEQITWVVTGYMLANVLIMPIIGMFPEPPGIDAIGIPCVPGAGIAAAGDGVVPG